VGVEAASSHTRGAATVTLALGVTTCCCHTQHIKPFRWLWLPRGCDSKEGKES